MIKPKEIESLLLQINAIKLSPQNPFTWASGMQSPIYCDNRISLSYPEVRNQIVNSFVKMCSAFENIDCIAGVATAGIPHGMLLADRLNLPFIYVRDKAKDHGKQNQIEGQIVENSNVIVVEDLISTGGSSIKAVKALRDANINVIAVIAIFDYNFEKATKNFENIDCICKTITNYDKLINYAKSINQFDAESIDLLEKWRKDPENWNLTTN
jgi:orotate phosphoribosyltransferase